MNLFLVYNEDIWLSEDGHGQQRSGISAHYGR